MAGSFLLAFSLGGCASIGPNALGRDHFDYGQVISDTHKREALLNVVRLRYGDGLTFLSVNTVVSSYTLETTGSASVIPNPVLGYAFPSPTGGVTYTDRPTMTFSPVTGAQLAAAFVHPLPLNDVFPLAQNGMPVDVLLRLAVQSIGRLVNTGRLENTPTSRSAGQIGSPDFFKLLTDLRTLQDGGALSFRFTKTKDDPHVYLSISDSPNPALTAAAARVRSLLGVGPGEIDIIYGRAASRPNQVAVITRSVVGILAHISAQIDVPEDDIQAHRTLPSIGYATAEQRPVVVVRTSRSQPQSTYIAVQFKNRWFWVADTDFDSKVAFSIVQILMDIAHDDTSATKGPILTIPASQ
jgi:hypothetical protein